MPYRRAKISFEPNGAQSFGEATAALEALSAEQIEQLLTDPHIIVHATFDDLLFWRVRGVEDLDVEHLTEAVVAEHTRIEARGTEAILAEHARIEAERERALSTGPQGDELANEGEAGGQSNGQDDTPPRADQTETSSPPDAGAGETAPAANETRPAQERHRSGRKK
ncbi:hypothetical protein [Polymorphobacter sp.]|uniref:hypothetical protein n=1 Tax=Polymorphobacter sp. TaxID=1909290 RepID=UPI003F6EFA3F